MTDTAPGPESLLDWMTGLVSDPVARARFAADPQHEIGVRGLADLDPADVAHALPLVTDTVAARFDLVVDQPDVPARLAGESAVDALARHFSTVPAAVGPAPDHDLDDWTESLADDLAGAPDGLEGVVDTGPGVDLDLDGTGDLDGVHHDHDLDVMTRLDVDHDLDGSTAAVAAATPTLAFLPGTGAPAVAHDGPAGPAAEEPVPEGDEPPAPEDELPAVPGHVPDHESPEQDLDAHDHGLDAHDHGLDAHDHGLDDHPDLDATP